VLVPIPIYYVLYTNDLPDVDESEAFMDADDKNVYRKLPLENYQQLLERDF
jgi:hypothetical protein